MSEKYKTQIDWISYIDAAILISRANAQDDDHKPGWVDYEDEACDLYRAKGIDLLGKTGFRSFSEIDLLRDTRQEWLKDMLSDFPKEDRAFIRIKAKLQALDMWKVVLERIIEEEVSNCEYDPTCVYTDKRDQMKMYPWWRGLFNEPVKAEKEEKSLRAKLKEVLGNDDKLSSNQLQD